MRMLSALLAVATVCASPEQVEVAKADYAREYAAGEDCRYLELGPDAEAALPVVQFMVVLASREPLLDHIVPEPIGANLVRIRLNRLRWSVPDWATVTGYQRNPYTPHRNPLIVPAAYLVDRIADATLGDAYHRLYFGDQAIPKTADDFLKAVGVDPAKQRGLAFGLVEGSSRVNVAGDAARLIRHDDGIRAEAWTTLDVKRVTEGSDPLEGLDGQRFKADGSEIFALVPKVSTRGVRGLFPVTALADGAGKLVAEAPVDLVEDATRFGNQAAIRNPGSCIQCHSAGPQQPTLNALRDRLKAGVELKAYDKGTQVALELFHLGEVDQDLKRWEEGYAAALRAVNGLAPPANAEAFRAFIDDYRADVTLQRAAAELHVAADDLRLALGYASANKIYTSARLAGLAHERTMPRTSWESEFLRAAEMVAIWKGSR